MPRPKSPFPAYRLHRTSGQARVIVGGRHIYLGPYDSPESRLKYSQLIAELKDPVSQLRLTQPSGSILTVAQVLVVYLEYAEQEYPAENGKPHKEFICIKAALKPLAELYHDLPGNEFGPKKLKTVREKLIEANLCRTEVNKRVGKIKRVFKWAVGEELLHPSVYEGLRAVDGLRYDPKKRVRESTPVRPVAEETVELTLAYVSLQVATMIRLQWLTGMRPGEVLAMKPSLIDQSGDVWLYQPNAHKNQWRGHQRVIPLGPQAQAALQPFLSRPGDRYLFSPAEAEQVRHDNRAVHRNRRTKIYPCELRAREKRKAKAAKRAAKSKRARGLNYTPESYRRAIAYGVKKSNRERLKTDAKAVKIPQWSPYQLRHSFATRLRKTHGVEAAQVGLGHARTNVVDVYAEKNLHMIVEIAGKVG